MFYVLNLVFSLKNFVPFHRQIDGSLEDHGMCSSYCIQLIQIRLSLTIFKWKMCGMHEHKKDDGNNIYSFK